MAQSVKHPTIGFGSCHHLMVYEFERRIRLCADSAEPDYVTATAQAAGNIPSNREILCSLHISCILAGPSQGFCLHFNLTAWASARIGVFIFLGPERDFLT